VDARASWQKMLGALAGAAALCAAHAAPTISAGTSHALAARADGTVVAWGADVQGELGQGALVQSSTARALSGLANVVSVAAGDGFVLALTRDGRVYSWGDNVFGQLGDGTQVTRADPRPIPSLTDAIAVAASWNVGLAVRRDGSVWSWGLSVSRPLGRQAAPDEDTSVPGRVPGIANVTAIWAGRYGVLALRADGTLWAWGANIGDGIDEDSVEPVLIPGLANVVSAAVGEGSHSMALLADGTVRAWGENDDGELGNGTRVKSLVPVPVSGLANVRSIAVTFAASAAVLNDGTVRTWGSNAFSMLGERTTGSSLCSSIPSPNYAPQHKSVPSARSASTP
jgi:alpha-tubulin suppressor-like RCC1 family protein